MVRAESPPEEEGLVTGQDPAGGASGETAELGTEVEITVGTGPDAVAVPGVVGNTTAQAEDILARSDLELGSVGQDYSDTVPEGSVISQDPAEGESLEPGSRVNVTESLGVEQVEVPEVYGVSVEEAQARLSNAGINSDPIEVDGVEAAGTALSTEPGVGALVDPGSTLPLYYSAGPEPTVASPEPDASAPPAEEPDASTPPEEEPDASAPPDDEPDEPEASVPPDEEPDASAPSDASTPPDAPTPPAPGGQPGGQVGSNPAREDGNSGPNRGSGGGNAGSVPPNVQENVQNNENVPGVGRGNGGGRGNRGGGGEED